MIVCQQSNNGTCSACTVWLCNYVRTKVNHSILCGMYLRKAQGRVLYCLLRSIVNRMVRPRQPGPLISQLARRQAPLIYVEVDDIRPDDDQGEENSAVVFLAEAAPLEVWNRMYSAGAAQLEVWGSEALLYDVIRLQIDKIIGVLFPNRQHRVNDHGFKIKNRVLVKRGREWVDGYIVAVTK